MLSYRKLAMRVLGRPLNTGGGINSPRPASQRAAALVLTAAMLTTLTAPAFAGTWYIEDGDITISAGESGNNVTQNENTTENDPDTIITNREEGASSHTVTIDAKDKDDKVEVTLKDVNIDASSRSEAAVSVTGKGDTTIELDGDNELKSGAGHAGLEHNKTDTSGELTIQDKDNNGSLEAAGGFKGAGIGSAGSNDAQVKITGGNITATSDDWGAGIGGGIYGLSNVTIEGNTKVNATGGAGGAAIGGGAGAENNSDNNGNQITIKSNENGSPTINAVGGGTDEGEKIVIGGAGIGAGCESNADADITLEGKVTITATAGKDNVAIGANGIEQEFSGLAEGSSITRYDPEGNDITLPTDPVPAVPSSSGGGSADASVQESVFPGLVVTDKDGQRISYTSIRDNNVLSLRVGRFTASLRASLATLRQLRAEGIDTITFQTILCSTTLSVDELLAMGGEDTEVVLTHHIRSSTLTVGGKAV